MPKKKIVKFNDALLIADRIYKYANRTRRYPDGSVETSDLSSEALYRAVLRACGYPNRYPRRGPPK